MVGSTKCSLKVDHASCGSEGRLGGSSHGGMIDGSKIKNPFLSPKQKWKIEDVEGVACRQLPCNCCFNWIGLLEEQWYFKNSC